MEQKKNMENKIKRSIKIYPIFYGLTADLFFWVAIQTLFLTTVKNLTASEINSLVFIGTAIALIIQIYSIKIIRKIGETMSVRVGIIMLLSASILFTVSNSYIMFVIAQILYSSGFIFKQMDSVILIKDLKYFGKQDDYIEYQNRGSILYSLITLVISIASGVLFNINYYLPMICCIAICVIDLILTFFIFEAPNSNTKAKQKNENPKFKYSKILMLLILFFGVFYGIIMVGQSNGKIFMQYRMEEILDVGKIAIYLSVIIAISRIIRFVSDSFFLKIYRKLKNNIIYVFELGLVSAFAFFIIGNFIQNGTIGTAVMALGFFTLLAIVDPFDNFMRKVCFDNCDINNDDKLVIYLSLSRKFGEILFSGIVTLILLKLSYVYVFLFMLIVAASYLIIINKIMKLLKKSGKKK